jgi:hypothetical protein
MRKKENWLFGFAAIGAVAALTKILEYVGIKPNWGSAASMVATIPVTPHDYSALGWGIVLFIFSIALSAYGFYLSMRSRKKTPAQTPPPSPLTIISAHWGIGGNAYKDVTDIVRDHAKPDSVNLPASIGLFGDPYPNATKHLHVAYSVARRWEVTVKEGEHLRLPEKEGEEQTRKDREARVAKAATLLTPNDRLIASLTEIEFNLYKSARSEFQLLPWSQKVALKRICDVGSIGVQELKVNLSRDGFSNPTLIIDDLVFKGFLERTHGGLLKPQATQAKWLEVLFGEIQLC